jgi:hypothetical protein
MMRFTYVTISVIAAVVLSASAGNASAQFGFGFGGLYNPDDGSRVQAAVDQRALSQGNAAYASRPKALSAPSFQQRDDSFYDKYDLATREAMINRVARNPAMERGTAYAGGSMDRPAPVPAPTPAAPSPSPIPPPPPRQVVRIGNFFDKRDQLVWPADAPSSGDLGTKRQAADLSATVVFKEYQSRGAATLESTSKARSQLTTYGQPALAYVTEHSTPAMADSFHAFLLTLYANLGDAYSIPASQGR